MQQLGLPSVSPKLWLQPIHVRERHLFPTLCQQRKTTPAVSISYAYLHPHPHPRLRAPQVTFEGGGEIGEDAGGLTREWFSLVADALLSTSALRSTERDRAFEYYPNPLATTDHERDLCEFVGAFLGKALLESSVPQRALAHGRISLGSLRLSTVL